MCLISWDIQTDREFVEYETVGRNLDISTLPEALQDLGVSIASSGEFWEKQEKFR